MAKINEILFNFGKRKKQVCSFKIIHFYISVDWAKFFSKEAVLERLKNAGKQALKQAIETASQELLKALGLPQVYSL